MKENVHNKNNSNIKDRIIEIVLIIVIILLLLHNCSLRKKDGKGIIDEGGFNIIDITCNSNKCEKEDIDVVDCKKDSTNSTCVVPDFRGQTKKELLKWLNSISDTIEIEIVLVENPDYTDGTIISQSVVGTSVKELLDSKTKLVITIVNNGSLIDCSKDTTNSKCSLPNFVGKKTSSVENWVSGIANQVNIKYVYVDSDKPSGTIVDQSVKKGTSVKYIINNNQTVIVYISKGKPNIPDETEKYIEPAEEPKPSTDNKTDTKSSEEQKPSTGDETEPTVEPTPEPEPEEPTEEEPVLDNDFYGSDKEKVKWQDETNLKIFEDSTNISKIKGKIAPESSGTYKFMVNNGTIYNLKYKVTFIETNQYGMNIKYKLKKGDTYLIDHYVYYDELNMDNLLLNTQSSDTYYLEWKWVGDSDNNDTQIGKNANSSNIEYSLKINIEAESV